MPATTNFSFLQGHDIRLVTFGAQAERYFRDDPSTAIVKLRQYAELLAKLVAAHHALYFGERETFEDTLRRAWADAKNEEIAASIIGFVRQAAIGDPLISYEDRVRGAMRRVLASRAWTEPQKRWLKRIGEQVEKEIVMDREAIDREPFSADGGFARLNRVFDGELESVLADINEEMWKKAG